MNLEQHRALLSLYKKALNNELDPETLAKERLNAKIQADQIFTRSPGREFLEFLGYIQEIEFLVKQIKNEQSGKH